MGGQRARGAPPPLVVDAAAERELSALQAIPRDRLDTTDQLAYDTFEFTTKDTLRGYQPDILSLTKVRPLNHFSGFHTFYPSFASGDSVAPFRNVEDYENNLKRHRQFVEVFDRVIARVRAGPGDAIAFADCREGKLGTLLRREEERGTGLCGEFPGARQMARVYMGF